MGREQLPRPAGEKGNPHKRLWKQLALTGAHNPAVPSQDVPLDRHEQYSGQCCLEKPETATAHEHWTGWWIIECESIQQCVNDHYTYKHR